MKRISKLEKELIELCHQCPPDIEAVNAKIAEGADVNAMTSYEPVLADVICGFGKKLTEYGYEDYSCQLLPDIVRVFLDAGYDVSRNNGFHGGFALFELTNCCPGPEILDAARILLDAGADPDVCPFDDEPEDTVIDLIWYESDFQAMENNLEQMRLLDQLLEMLKATSKKDWD